MARWKKIRHAHLSCDPLCAYCRESEDITIAEVVDHIRPHKGDAELFWDPRNLQSLCKACHDGRKQREELGQTVVTFGPDGWPV